MTSKSQARINLENILQTSTFSSLTLPTDNSGIPQYLMDLHLSVEVLDKNQSQLIQAVCEIFDTAAGTHLSLSHAQGAIGTIHHAIASVSSSGGGGSSGTIRISTSTTNVEFAKPEKFNRSDKSMLPTFKITCMEYLKATRPAALDTDKIIFYTSYMIKSAAAWLTPHKINDMASPGSVSWLHEEGQFWTKVEKRFGIADLTETYRLQYDSLKQTISVQDYLKDFQTYSDPLGYSKVELKQHFYNGLKLEIHKLMFRRGFKLLPTDGSTMLKVLYNTALEIDQQQESWNRLHKNRSTGTSSGTPSSSKTKKQKYNKGDKIFTTRTGKAEKGTFLGVAQEDGKAYAELKWDSGGTEKIEFHQIRPDERPRRQPAVPGNSSFNKPACDPKGPGPMELGQTGNKGKDPVVCYNCGGRGHTSRQCSTPQKNMLGHKAQLMEVDLDDEAPGYEDAMEESSKGNA